jgi:hypothetical protein
MNGKNDPGPCSFLFYSRKVHSVVALSFIRIQFNLRKERPTTPCVSLVASTDPDEEKLSSHERMLLATFKTLHHAGKRYKSPIDTGFVLSRVMTPTQKRPGENRTPTATMTLRDTAQMSWENSR